MPDSNVPTLYGRMELSLTDAEKRLAKFNATLDKTLGISERRTAQSAATMQKAIERFGTNAESSFAALGRTIGSVFAGIASAAAAKELLDSATRIQNALKVAGLSGEALNDVYKKLFDSAQKNATPLESLVTLYGRLSVVSKELHASQSDVLGFSDTIAKALRVGNVGPNEAQSALLQLSQALGSGTVHAEEFNSVQEAALPILQAAAAGIKEAGGSVNQLKQLMLQGKLSSEALFRGILAGSQILDQRLAGSALTVENAFTKMNNALTDAVGKLDHVTDASGKIVTAIGQVSDYISALSNVFASAAAGPIGQYLGKLNDVLETLNKLHIALPGINPLAGLPSADDINKLSGVLNPPGASRDDLQKELANLRYLNVNDPNSNTDVNNQRIGEILSQLYGDHDTRFPLRGQAKPVMPSTTMGGISLQDYPTSPAKATKTGGSAKMDDYSRAVQSLNQETAALTAQKAALAGLNPLQADYQQKILATEKAQDLLTAAQKGGKAVGKELSDVQQLLYGDLSKLSPAARQQAEEIRKVALGYADVSTQVDKLKAAQEAQAEAAKDALEFEKDTLNDALTTFRQGLASGETAWESLRGVALNVLTDIADRLQKMAVDALFDGVTSNLFSRLFTSSVGSIGGAVGSSVGAGAVNAASAAMPRAIVPAAARVSASSAATSTRIHVDVTGARGNQEIMSMVAAGVKQGIDHNNRTRAPAIAIAAVREAQQRGG